MWKIQRQRAGRDEQVLSFVLRHKPEAIGIVLDGEGWADIDKAHTLCPKEAGKRLTAHYWIPLSPPAIKSASYSSDGTCIRAVQGHSTSQVAIAFTVKNTALDFSTTVRGKPFP